MVSACLPAAGAFSTTLDVVCPKKQGARIPLFALACPRLTSARNQTGPALQATCVELQVQADNMGRRLRRIEQENSKLEARLREAEDVSFAISTPDSKTRIRAAAQTMQAPRIGTPGRAFIPLANPASAPEVVRGSMRAHRQGMDLAHTFFPLLFSSPPLSIPSRLHSFLAPSENTSHQQYGSVPPARSIAYLAWPDHMCLAAVLLLVQELTSTQESKKGVEEELRGKVGEIEALNKEIEKASDRNRSAEASLRLSLTRQESTVSKARMDLSAAEESVSRLTDELAQRDAVIERLKRSQAEASESMSQRSSTKESQERTIASFSARLAEQREIYQRMQKEADEAHSQAVRYLEQRQGILEDQLSHEKQ